MELPPTACACPECGHTFEPAEPPVNGILDCPACRAQFFAPAPEAGAGDDDNDDDDAADEARRAEEARRREDELDVSRLRQVAAYRRGLYRSRSLVIIGVVGLLVAAVQLAFYTIGLVRAAGWGTRPTAYVFAAIACLMGAAMVFRRVPAINRELRDSAQKEPDRPPDFSTLSDGTHNTAWNKLAQMQERE
jgi:hypothetical protein